MNEEQTEAPQQEAPQQEAPQQEAPQQEAPQQEAIPLAQLVAMPLPEHAARIQLANLDIQLAQCRQRLAEVNREIADIEAIRTVILRRVLNPIQAEGASPDGSSR